MKHTYSFAMDWLGKHWKGIVSGVVITCLAGITLSLQLSSLVPGQNRFETATLAGLKTFPYPWHSALNAIYNVPAYSLGKFLNNPLQGARITSVIFGLLATACLFYILKIWFNVRIATVGSLLFITSSWLLQVIHQASPMSLLIFTPLFLIAPLAWYLRTKKYKNLAFFAFAACLALSLYVPYMFWIAAVVLTILVLRANKKLVVMKTWQIVAAAFMYFLLITPLFMSLAKYPGQLHQFFGIPTPLPSIGQYFSHMYNTVAMVFFRSPALPELHIGRLPMLDIFSSAMFILGIYYFVQRLSKRHSLILLCCLIMLLIIIPLSSLYQLNASIFIPFVYICIITGIVELLNRWFSYFPRNPWARNLGVALIVVAIGFVSFYHLDRYFVAWPNTPETKAVYVIKSN